MSILSQEQAEEMLAALNEAGCSAYLGLSKQALALQGIGSFCGICWCASGQENGGFGVHDCKWGLSEISSISEVLRSLLGRDDANPSVTV